MIRNERQLLWHPGIPERHPLCRLRHLERRYWLHLQGVHAGPALLRHQSVEGRLQCLHRRIQCDGWNHHCDRQQSARNRFELVRHGWHCQALVRPDRNDQPEVTVSGPQKQRAAEQSAALLRCRGRFTSTCCRLDSFPDRHCPDWTDWRCSRSSCWRLSCCATTSTNDAWSYATLLQLQTGRQRVLPPTEPRTRVGSSSWNKLPELVTDGSTRVRHRSSISAGVFLRCVPSGGTAPS